jgi:hypothetical protein
MYLEIGTTCRQVSEPKCLAGMRLMANVVHVLIITFGLQDCTARFTDSRFERRMVAAQCHSKFHQLPF